VILPQIHRSLTRSDLACLLDEMARSDRRDAADAAEKLEAGEVDEVLDAPAAVAAVRGRAGVPGSVPLALLWYVPIRAELRVRDEPDVELADYTATLCVAFQRTPALRVGGARAAWLSDWWEAIRALPSGTVAQGERAADCGGLALWWVGCFPERIERLGAGAPRAYTTFAATALTLAARMLAGQAPAAADLFHRAAERADVLRESLAAARADYLGRDAHSTEGRLTRFLSRLEPPSTM
jgi:hypothetical protein